MGETIGVNVLKRAQNMEISTQFDGYSAVRIFVGTDDNGSAVIYEAGNTNGRTLEIKNPFGTQEMANNILAEIQGYQYQPLSADNALLNPAAEMGDGVTVNGVYSGLFVRATQFGRLMASDIAAPTDEEIEHEFAVENASDRQYTRFVQQTKAMLKITNMAIEAEVSERESADSAINATLAIHATDIQARVTKQSPAGQTSFGWNLTDTEWSVFSGSPSNKILTASASGLKVKGRIEADEGYIGGENGFVITANKIYKNISRFGGSQSSGVYIGTDGIQLGRDFKVDSSGNLMAASGTFTGTVYAGNISYGADAGYFDGDGLVGSSVGTGQLSSYANGGIGSGYSAQTTWNEARNRNEGVDLVNATTLLCYNLTVSSSASIADMYYQGYSVEWLGFTDGDGNSHFVLGSY